MIKKIVIKDIKTLYSSAKNRATCKNDADYFAENTFLQRNKAITVKSVQIRTFSGHNFPVVGLNRGKYGPIKVYKSFRTLFMQWIGSWEYPASSKFANVTPVFKIDSGDVRKN